MNIAPSIHLCWRPFLRIAAVATSISAVHVIELPETVFGAVERPAALEELVMVDATTVSLLCCLTGMALDIVRPESRHFAARLIDTRTL